MYTVLYLYLLLMFSIVFFHQIKVYMVIMYNEAIPPCRGKTTPSTLIHLVMQEGVTPTYAKKMEYWLPMSKTAQTMSHSENWNDGRLSYATQKDSI